MAHQPSLPRSPVAAVSVIVYQRGGQSFLWVTLLHIQLNNAPETTFGDLQVPQEIAFGLLP